MSQSLSPVMNDTRLSAALEHPLMRQLSELSEGLGAEIHLVGGAVRDLLLTGEMPRDLDFMVINASASDLAKAAADRLPGRYILLDETFGIHRVVLEDGLSLDLSDALGNSLERDLARRDLTLNAMALCPRTGAFSDPFNGRRDLADGVIRMVSESNLEEDPLRMLRVFRIAAQLQAKNLDGETLSSVAQHKEKIHNVAAERINYEFLRLLDANPCFDYLKAMADAGLLEEILPELRATRPIPPNGHHHLWLFDHTLELVRQTEELLPQIPAATREKVSAPFNRVVSRLGVIKLACLLHDIGKPATMVENEGARTTYYGHDTVSETMTEEICQRWKVSNDLASLVKKLVRWHLYPCQFGPESPRKSVLRFFRRMGAETPDVLLLALADRFSTRGDDITEAILEQSFKQHVWLMEQYEAESETLNMPRLLNGNQVMDILGIPPGPRIKEVLEALQEAQQLGEVKTGDEAKSWVSARFGE